MLATRKPSMPTRVRHSSIDGSDTDGLPGVDSLAERLGGAASLATSASGSLTEDAWSPNRSHRDMVRPQTHATRCIGSSGIGGIGERQSHSPLETGPRRPCRMGKCMCMLRVMFWAALQSAALTTSDSCILAGQACRAILAGHNVHCCCLPATCLSCTSRQLSGLASACKLYAHGKPRCCDPQAQLGQPVGSGSTPRAARQGSSTEPTFVLRQVHLLLSASSCFCACGQIAACG